MNEKKDEAVHGGPQSYYDFLPGWVTLNDMMEWLAANRWMEHSIYIFNIMKACYRWGGKNGTTKEYDAKKMVYYSARLYMMLTSRRDLRKYLIEMLEDPQFRDE